MVDWYIYYGFCEESKKILYKLVAADDIVIDVGTNVGEITMNIASIIGKNGIVHSFEPFPINYNRFLTNLSLNSFQNIVPNKFGLSNEKGKFIPLINDQKNLGMTSLATIEDANTENNTIIDVITLDEYITIQNIKKVSVIKIDVEGFELKVLQGARNTIQKDKPKLFVELDNNNLIKFNNSSKDLVKYLESLNYCISLAENGKIINSGDDFENCHFDIIGVPNKTIL